MREDDRLVLHIALTERQQRQLVAVSDELGVPMHEVGEEAIVAFPAAHGHHARGQEKRAVRRRGRTRTR